MTRRMLCALLIYSAVLLLSPVIFALAHHEDFEGGIAGWAPFRTGEGASALIHSRDAAHSGDYSLRVETRGMTRSEGVKKTFRVEPGGRHTVTVNAKGDGRVMLCAFGPGGALYGRHTDLTPEWQELKISIFKRGTALTPNVITAAQAQKVVFHIDDLKITRAPAPEVFDVEVGPVKFQAQDYPHNATIVEDASAGGGAYAEGRRWFVLGRNMPFPATSRPVYIYLRVWIEDNEKHSITVFNRMEGQGPEPVEAVTLPAAGEWAWIKTGPYEPGRFVDGFSIGHSGPDARAVARFDCAVVSTREGLTEEELDAVGR